MSSIAQPMKLKDLSVLSNFCNHIHFFPQRAKALLSSSSEELRLEALLGRLAKNESLFRRRSSSYLGQRPTAITGYLNIFQGCWNQCFQVWHCMSIAKSGKLRISQDFANSCRMPCFARLHVEEAIAEAEGVQTLQLCQTRQERKCIFATTSPP